jgi:hypothetical protein
VLVGLEVAVDVGVETDVGIFVPLPVIAGVVGEISTAPARTRTGQTACQEAARSLSRVHEDVERVFWSKILSTTITIVADESALWQYWKKPLAPIVFEQL